MFLESWEFRKKNVGKVGICVISEYKVYHLKGYTPYAPTLAKISDMNPLREIQTTYSESFRNLCPNQSESN